MNIKDPEGNDREPEPMQININPQQSKYTNRAAPSGHQRYITRTRPPNKPYCRNQGARLYSSRLLNRSITDRSKNTSTASSLAEAMLARTSFGNEAASVAEYIWPDP